MVLGLKVNFSKSKFFGIFVNESETNTLASILNLQPSYLPCSYLGLPIGTNLKKCNSWKPIIDKFQNRLTSWKAITLSFGGRLTLSKSVLRALGTSLIISVYENQDGLDRMDHYPSWLLPSAWKVITGLNKHLLKVNCDLNVIFSRKVGDGATGAFWIDAWIWNLNLKTAFPRLYSLEVSKDSLVVDQKEIKQIKADDQAIQTIFLGLFKDIYAAIDSYETAQEIWLRVQQMMKGSDIGIQEKKAKQMQMVGDDGGNQFRHYARQNVGNLNGYNDVQNVGNQVIQNVAQNLRVRNIGNQNGLIGVLGNANHNLNGNGYFVRNCIVRPRRKDDAYLQTQLLIAQKEEAGIQPQVKEFELMAAAADLDEIEEVNANCILMANLQMTLETHNRSSSAHQELHKIIKDENFLIVNQVDARVQNFEIQFLEEAAKFVGDFKSLAKEVDESLAKHKGCKKRIEKLQHDRLLNSSDLTAFEKCVSYVCGPFKIMSRQGEIYFVTFTDDFSRYGYVYLLKHKHEVFETFKVVQKEVENQLRKTIKSLCTDRGGEYMSQEFLDNLKDHGIIAHRTPPYTLQHNGVSGRRNRTLLDMGCEALVKRDTLTKPDKLESRSIKCIFVGYPKETMGYSFYYLPENKVIVARNAEFLENSLIDQEASGSLEDLKIIQEEDTHPSLDTSLNHEEGDLEIDEPQSDIVPIRRSTRTRHAPYHMCLYIDVEEHELGDLGEPAIYKAALLDLESEKWLNAMNVEMQSMKDNEVWVLVELPPNGKTVGIAGIRAIRILIAIAAYYDYEIWQMDVKTAFLNGYLNEEEKLKLSKSQGASTPAEMKRMKNVPYASAVRSIMYAVRCTRPDVANTKDMFLVYGGDLERELRVSCYTDAGYLTDADDLKSQTGYVFVLNGGAVDWKSAKQSIFANSSAEAEYIAAFDASKEAVWVRKFISRLSVVPTFEEPINMYCDNTGAIAIANESGITNGARHFGAKVHYLREVIEFGDIKLKKVHTNDNLANPFTKALAFPKHSKHTKNIGMLPASSLM
nr:hypothetical protein [Tanacetum cinerariifolium]